MTTPTIRSRDRRSGTRCGRQARFSGVNDRATAKSAEATIPTHMGEPTAPTQPARDQLSLSLEAELPRLPASLRPMLPRPLPEPFDSPDHLFEPSWAGVRALAFCDAADRGALGLLDSEGTDLASRLPELADLCSRLMATSAVVDGELVVVDAAGRADAPGLATRLAGSPGPSVAYLVFDLLYLDGRPLLGSHSSGDGRRSAGRSRRANRWSPFQRSRPRVGRCTMRSSPRASRESWPGSARDPISRVSAAGFGDSFRPRRPVS